MLSCSNWPENLYDSVEGLEEVRLGGRQKAIGRRQEGTTARSRKQLTDNQAACSTAAPGIAPADRKKLNQEILPLLQQ